MLTSLFSADVLKKCALIALHDVAEEGRDGDGCHVPGPRDEWKISCPKSPRCESEGEVWAEDESVSSSGYRQSNVCNDALHVIGLYGLGGKISLFLQDWELAQVALSCHLALDMLCQEMYEVLVAGLPLPKVPLSQQEKAFSHRGRAVTKTETDVVRE